MEKSLDSFGARAALSVGKKTYNYFSLAALSQQGFDIKALPFSIRVFLENLLRHEDGVAVKKNDIAAVAASAKNPTSREVFFTPARVLMQDFTGVPAVVDLAAMREAMKALGGDPNQLNPLQLVDLVVDHSVLVVSSGLADSF